MMIPWWGYLVCAALIYAMGWSAGHSAGQAKAQAAIMAGLIRQQSQPVRPHLMPGVSNVAEKPQGQRDAQ